MQLKIPYGEHVRAEYRTLVARERQLRLPSCRKGTNAAEGLQFFLRPVKQSFSTESLRCRRSGNRGERQQRVALVSSIEVVGRQVKTPWATLGHERQ